MKKALFFPIFTLLLHCNKYKEIKDTENPFIINSSPTFEGYFYKGSDNTFDYFESKWKFESNKKFKISKKTFLIKTRFEKNLNQEVKIDIFKTPKIFGIRKFDTIYISNSL